MSGGFTPEEIYRLSANTIRPTGVSPQEMTLKLSQQDTRSTQKPSKGKQKIAKGKGELWLNRI